MNQFSQMIRRYVTEHPGRSIGAAAGCVVGILLLTLGIKKTLILMLLILFGYVIGNLFETPVSLNRIKDLFSRNKSGKYRSGRDKDFE